MNHVEQSKLHIGGKLVEPAGTGRIEVVSPVTEDVIGSVPAGTVEDVDAAVRAAREAFDHGPWPRMSHDERRGIVLRAGKILEPRTELITELVSSANGVPVRNMPGHTSGDFEYYGNLPLPEEARRQAGPGNAALVVHEPVGVVGCIVPWNAPVFLGLGKILPALLAGNTVVLKPSPETPFHDYVIAEAFAEAGLPEGVLNVVPAHREVAESLVRHPGVDMISFTGSTAAGRRIGAICGENIRHTVLELGGKSAAIVLDDADFGVVAPFALNTGVLMNNGEACSAWTRLLVPRHRHDEAVEAFVEVLRGVVIGDPLDPATELGPLVASRQRERVEGYIASGLADGAKLATGGGRPVGLERGWYVEPTLFVGADNGMRIAREEIFGPVGIVLPYDDVDEAVAIANDSEYGLAAAVFTADQDRGIGVARRLRAGTVGVNSLGMSYQYPFGGYKDSGLGRSHGPEGFLEFFETKTIGLASLPPTA